ncbi:MAG: hypothetical protein MUP49_00870 [Dehalococcoidia bacterium]|nr:hypothetical protein [Dehalococcoidia bacterium]
MGIIVERVLSALDAWKFHRTRMLTPKPILQTRTYTQPRIVKQHETKIPLFGSDPSVADYSVVRTISPAPQGVVLPGVSRSIVNRSGSLANLGNAHLDGKSEIQEERRVQTSESGPTDQRTISGSRSAVAAWDGQVRSGQKNPGFQAVRGKSADTPSAQHERDLRNAPYDFST